MLLHVIVLLGVVACLVGALMAVFRSTLPLLRAYFLAVPLWAVVEGIARADLEGAVIGAITGACLAASACLGTLAVRLGRARRAYVDRGWAVARAEAREHDIRVREAILRERQSMAGEIHDGLGHRLTLLAVQAGKLSLDESLPEAVREELSAMREAAATASYELGQTVRLLDRSRDCTLTPVTAPVDQSVTEVVTRALESGLEVHADLEPGLEARLGDFTRAAVLRAVQEGLTNAAKHAPGKPVNLQLRSVQDPDEVELALANARAQNPPPAPVPGSGYGLGALQHRARLLGGSLSIDGGAEEFQLTLRLPTDAVPHEPGTESAEATGGAEALDANSREAVVAGELSRSQRRRSTSALLMLLVPALLTAGAVVAAAGWFVYATFASVMSEETFALIDVGTPQAEVEQVLPAVDMLDAPRSQTDALDGECHYYEASLSFFERDDVYRICFERGAVSAATTIPAP